MKKTKQEKWNAKGVNIILKYGRRQRERESDRNRGKTRVNGGGIHSLESSMLCRSVIPHQYEFPLTAGTREGSKLILS